MARPAGVVLLAVGYGAGLVTGLTRLTTPGLVVPVVSLLVLLSWREWWLPLVAALGSGILSGTHAREVARASCVATLPLGEVRYHLHAVDPGDGTGRVVVRDRACGGMVPARWPRQAGVLAGTDLVATARWLPSARPLGRPDGLLLVGAIDSLRDVSSAVERWRNSTRRAARALYGARAPLALALVAGWRGELDPDVRAAFASAGLMHLLAISGAHVALLAGWTYLLCRIGRVPRHQAECAGAIVALGYCALLGWPVAALRASLLLALAVACRWRQRQVRFEALLGTSVLLTMALDPWSIAQPGLWLSIAGVAGLVSATRWSERSIGRHWLARGVSGSTGALIATAPLAAGVFGQVAPVGVFLNVVGMPLLAALIPALFASVLLWPLLPSLARAAAASGNGMLALLELLARIGSGAPGSAEPGRAGWLAAVPWLGALGVAIWASWGGTTVPEAVRRVAWSGTAALALMLVVPTRARLAPEAGTLTLLFVDVGQGDAALMRTPLGHWIEVDAGPVGEGRDAGRRVIAPLLAREGVARIDLFVLSHAHRDHVGGGPGVLERIPITLAVEPGELFADSAYDAWLGALATHHTRWRVVKAGAHWTIDGVTFRVLHPPSPWSREGEDLNEDSIILDVSYGGFRAVLMGDAGMVAEPAIAAEVRPVDVLKVGHHGSRTASGAEFLAEIHPQAAIISVGRNNYGHPAPETLARLADAGAATWRTDVDGTVTVTTDGRTVRISGARSSATFETRH